MPFFNACQVFVVVPSLSQFLCMLPFEIYSNTHIQGVCHPAIQCCHTLTPFLCSTYIGSTPNPLRRIRYTISNSINLTPLTLPTHSQHNGEIAQGASKTKHKRPWVMQMIVHGFPSRLVSYSVPQRVPVLPTCLGCTPI